MFREFLLRARRIEKAYREGAIGWHQRRWCLTEQYYRLYRKWPRRATEHTTY